VDRQEDDRLNKTGTALLELTKKLKDREKNIISEVSG
jgi:hypothetical protein